MKKPSDTKPSLSLHDLTFFTDRDLGKAMPGLLRQNGLKVERYFDHFTEGIRVEDNRWLDFAFRQGWVALSHDDNIRRDPEAVRCVMEWSGRLFIIRGAVPTLELGEIFLEARASVLQILERNQGQAFIANIRRSVLQGGIVRCAAHSMLTFEQWVLGKLPRED